MIRSLPLTVLSLMLGFFFVFVGLIKVTPKVNEQIHADMKQEFGRYNKVFPLYKFTGWRPHAKNFRMTVGTIEILSGATLILIPGPAKEFATVVLLILMQGAFYTHYSLGDSFERIAPSLVFGLLLICRMVIYYQVCARERKDEDFQRKMFEDTIGNEEDDQNVEDNSEEDFTLHKKRLNADVLITNKKNVANQSDREEKKIK